MEQSNKAQTTEVMEWIGMSKKITEKEISDFLTESNFIIKAEKIKFEKLEFTDLDDATSINKSKIRKCQDNFQSRCNGIRRVRDFEGADLP
jgi:hypothetical protein